MYLSPEEIWKYQQVIYAEILEDLHGHFSGINAPYMPIKGAYLICSNLAGKMALRRMDDIDILVQEKDFERVCDHLSLLPQVKFIRHKWYFEKEFDYFLGSYPCHLEIHFLLNYPARFDLPTFTLFTRSRQMEGMRFFPSHEDALLILLCHALVHIAFELRETLFEEITLLSCRQEFSWKLFWEYADSTGVKQFIMLLLSGYARETGIRIPLPELPLAPRLLRPLLSKQWYIHMPFFVRKVLLEIPFLREPWWLFRNKLKMMVVREVQTDTDSLLH